MYRVALAFALLLTAGLITTGRASAQTVLALVRAGRWAEADALAAKSPDPVAGKLVTYYRLLNPGTAGAAEIGTFMAQNPEWPQQAALARRRDAALAAEPDDAIALAECNRTPPPPVMLPDALLRCAEAAAHTGDPGAAADFARHAWGIGPADAVWEAKVMQLWAAVVTRADQLARFDRLAWTDTAAAARQLARLDADDRPLGIARLALRRDDASAGGIVAALPAALQSDPALMLERARWLRRAGLDDDALALWRSAGDAAEQAAPAERRGDFWVERNLLARRRLRQGDNEGAYALADDHAQLRGEQVVDAEFLAGFIALEKLRDRPAAIGHFQALAAVSHAAITQARAHYWLARAGAGDAATAEYRRAAAYPSTFYGQLASIALGEGWPGLAARIADSRDPPATVEQGVAYAGRELTRAAAHLVAWGEPRRAAPFLLRLQETAPDAIDTALAGRLATALDLPDVAVAMARRAGTAGLIPLETGWPLAADIPATAPVEPALALGIIRQESSFEPTVVSPAGARGLMQLMPATAAATARRLATPVTLASLTADPSINIRLGTAYVRTLMDQYGNSVPAAVAAYNAGPRRVADWIEANGDPRSDGVDPIDWIELIPFNETRNYVQRVIENLVIYRAKLGASLPHPLAKRPA